MYLHLQFAYDSFYIKHLMSSPQKSLFLPGAALSVLLCLSLNSKKGEKNL